MVFSVVINDVLCVLTEGSAILVIGGDLRTHPRNLCGIADPRQAPQIRTTSITRNFRRKYLLTQQGDENLTRL